MVFLHKEYGFQPTVCSSCHDILMMPIDIICILNIPGLDYIILPLEVPNLRR